MGSYDVREVIDAYNAPSYTPTGEATRNFAWAGHVMDNFGFDVDLLVNDGVSRAQAITGVQAAIWEGIYGGGIVKIDSLSAGARSVYEMIVAPDSRAFWRASTARPWLSKWWASRTRWSPPRFPSRVRPWSLVWDP